jgi:hypothetical protein
VVIYPKVGLWADGSHHNLVLNFYEDYARPEVVREDIDGLLDRISAEAGTSRRDIVISSEILGGRQKPGKFIRALAARLGPDFGVEIVVGIRDHFERAASVYNQRVKDGITRELRDPDEFLVEQARGLVYGPLLRRFTDEQFQVTALNYHPAADFVSRFLGKVGFADEQIPRIQVRNVSLSTKGLIATLAANRVAQSPGDRPRLFDVLRHISGFHGPSQFIFGQAAARSADVPFAQDRTFLEEQFAISLQPPDLVQVRSGFRISEAEFDEISGAVAHLGAPGAALCTHVRPYVSVPG